MRLVLSPNRGEDRAMKATAAVMLALSLFAMLRSCAHVAGFDISTWTYAQVRASMEARP